jgi:2-amino-4-hydroxy-6-hydroxymethyldihydropteridine diphosphokinase
VSRVRAWIGLGANLGDAAATLRAATVELATLPETGLVASSSLYRSAPVDAVGPDFINAVVVLNTGLSAEQLLAALQAIELDHGRDRSPAALRNAARTLDLDLLLFGDRVFDTPHLTLPHPRLQLRAFVLLPLLEIDPGATAPGLGRLSNWLDGVRDQTIERFD